MKYPKVDYAVKVVSKTDNTYHLYNEWTDINLVMDAEDYDFMMKLDGKTDPYSIDPEREDVEDFLEYLERERLIRTGRFLTDTLIAFFTVWTPRKNDRLEEYAPVLNRLLMILAPLCFCLGLQVWNTSYDCSPVVYFAGEVFGVVTGAFFHELGHGIATLAYGGKVHEFGVGITYLLPMAYTAIETDDIKSRIKQAQIMLAGPEVNFLLSGFCLILTVVHPSCFLEAAAMTNFVLALLNLMGSILVDGFKIILNLLGVKIEGDLSFKSLKKLPDVSLKGFHKWAFYISMIAVVVTHIIGVAVILSPIWEVFFG